MKHGGKPLIRCLATHGGIGMAGGLRSYRFMAAIVLYDGQKTGKAQALVRFRLDHDAVTILPLFAFRELVVVQVTERLLADRLEQRVKIFPGD